MRSLFKKIKNMPSLEKVQVGTDSYVEMFENFKRKNFPDLDELVLELWMPKIEMINLLESIMKG